MSRLLLGLAAAGLAVVFVFAPLEHQVTEYTWEPSTDGVSVPLLLTERVPDVFRLSLPCPDGQEDRDLFRSSRDGEVPALTARTRDGQLIVKSRATSEPPGGTPVELVLPVPDGEPCRAEVNYRRRHQHLELRVGDGSTESRSDGFEITGLHWLGPESDAVVASVETSPAAEVRNSPLQKVLLGSIALLALVAAALRLRESAWRPPPGWWRPRASEWSMLAVATVVAIIDLPRVDDGRILSRARALAGWDLPANAEVLLENRIMPQRWVYEWLLGSLTGWSSVVVVLRSLSVLAAVLAWALLRRTVLPVLSGARTPTHVVVIAWTVHATFVVGWFATLRPEPFIVLLVTGVLAAITTWPEEPRSWPYTVVIGCAGLAVATHVAGLVAVVAGLPVVVRFFVELRRDVITVVGGVVWGVVAAIVALFVGSNLRLTVDAIAGFRGGDHGYGPLDTTLYFDAIQNSTVPMMLSAGLAAVAIVPLLVVGLRSLAGRREVPLGLLAGLCLAPFGLVFTPSKWLWHLAVLAPVAVGGWAVLAAASRRRHAHLVAVATTITLGVLLSWALRPAWHPRMVAREWREVALRSISTEVWGARVPWLVGPDLRWWLWVALLALVAALAWWLASRSGSADRAGTAVAVALLVCAGTSSVVQLSPPVVDAVVSGGDWTFVRQSVLGTVSREAACGIPPAVRGLPDHIPPSVWLPSGGERVTIAGHSMVYMYAPCHRIMAQDRGVWVAPRIVLGDLKDGQWRAVTEYDVVPLACLDEVDGVTGPCLSELRAGSGPFRQVESRWTTDLEQ